MQDFALTHSLTLRDDRALNLKIVLLVRKQSEGALPCFWFRADVSGFVEAISIGEAALLDQTNLAIAVAGPEVADETIAERISDALSSEGLSKSQLIACRDLLDQGACHCRRRANGAGPLMPGLKVRKALGSLAAP